MTNQFIEQHKREFDPSGPPWLKKLRKEGLKNFQFLGLPNKKQEVWKYTDVKPIFQNQYKLGQDYQPENLNYDELKCVQLGKLPGNRITFVNGHYAPQLSHLKNLPPGVEVRSLREVLSNEPERVQKYLGAHASSEHHPFIALNSAFLDDGAFICLKKGTVLERPLELFYFSLTNGQSIVSHPRNLIVAEEGSQGTIVENYAGKKSERNYFTNAVSEVVTHPGSALDHYKFQDELENSFHLSSMAVYQERESRFTSYNISLGAALSRNEIHTHLNAEGAECYLKGLYMVQGSQHVDNQTFVDHAQPHCTSQELYKGILADKSQGVFDGRILVEPHAQKTSSSLTNNNLLLSKEALINTKPLLEIFADDVKCSHGATIGRLDESQVFYLRSRGIDDQLSRNLLTYAFASEVIQDMKIKFFKAHLEEVILNRLHIGEQSVEGERA